MWLPSDLQKLIYRKSYIKGKKKKKASQLFKGVTSMKEAKSEKCK